jgi:hypothetical protein
MGYASTQALDEDAAELLVKGVIASATLTETDDPQFLYEGGDTPDTRSIQPCAGRDLRRREGEDGAGT